MSQKSPVCAGCWWLHHAQPGQKPCTTDRKYRRLPDSPSCHLWVSIEDTEADLVDFEFSPDPGHFAKFAYQLSLASGALKTTKGTVLVLHATQRELDALRKRLERGWERLTSLMNNQFDKLLEAEQRGWSSGSLNKDLK